MWKLQFSEETSLLGVIVKDATDTHPVTNMVPWKLNQWISHLDPTLAVKLFIIEKPSIFITIKSQQICYLKAELKSQKLLSLFQSCPFLPQSHKK